MDMFRFEDSEVLNFWQRLQFCFDSSEAKPSDIADTIRGLLFQIRALHARYFIVNRLTRQGTEFHLSPRTSRTK